MGRQSKDNSKTRFSFGGADSEVAPQELDLWILCSKFAPDSKWNLRGPRYRSKQGKQTKEL